MVVPVTVVVALVAVAACCGGGGGGGGVMVGVLGVRCKHSVALVLVTNIL